MKSTTTAAAVVIAVLLAIGAGCSNSDDDVADAPSATADSTPDTDDADTTSAAPDDEDPASTPEDDTGAPGADSADEDTTTTPDEPAQADEAPSVGVHTLDPVAVEEEAPFGDGLVAIVTDIDEVELEAGGPGETAGPGIAVTLELRNDASEPIDLAGIVVNATYGEDIPAVANNTFLDQALGGELAPGDSRAGVYGFRLPLEELDSVVIEVYHAESPNIVIVTL